jgi:hypothetical protein
MAIGPVWPFAIIGNARLAVPAAAVAPARNFRRLTGLVSLM